MNSTGSIKTISIKEFLRKAEELYTISRQIAIDSGILDKPYISFVIEPYIVVDVVQKKLGYNILSKNRKKENVEAKRTIAYLLRKYTGLSLKMIGEYIYATDHTTVLHHIKTMEDYLDVDERIQVLMHDIENDLMTYHTNKQAQDENSNDISALQRD